MRAALLAALLACLALVGADQADACTSRLKDARAELDALQDSFDDLRLAAATANNQAAAVREELAQARDALLELQAKEAAAVAEVGSGRPACASSSAACMRGLLAAAPRNQQRGATCALALTLLLRLCLGRSCTRRRRAQSRRLLQRRRTAPPCARSWPRPARH